MDEKHNYCLTGLIRGWFKWFVTPFLVTLLMVFIISKDSYPGHLTVCQTDQLIQTLALILKH